MSTTPEEHEQIWLQGNRAAWLALLTQALKELGVNQSEIEQPLVGMARTVSHLEETRKALRIICRRHGDNNWDDDLHLADVIDKHLGEHLNAASRGHG